jgi:hypothetical protein
MREIISEISVSLISFSSLLSSLQVPTRQKRGFYVYGGNSTVGYTENQVLFFDTDFYQWNTFTASSG